MTTFIPIVKTSRTGPNGRLIQCPHCNYVACVGHFSWSSLVCTGCHSSVDKTDWTMEKK
jgi:hypothetical protein